MEERLRVSDYKEKKFLVTNLERELIDKINSMGGHIIIEPIPIQGLVLAIEDGGGFAILGLRLLKQLVLGGPALIAGPIGIAAMEAIPTLREQLQTIYDHCFYDTANDSYRRQREETDRNLPLTLRHHW